LVVGCGDAAEVSVFESVGVSFDGDDVGVVDEAVDHGGGDGVVAEDVAPASEGFVAGDDERGAFVAGGDVWFPPDRGGFLYAASRSGAAAS